MIILGIDPGTATIGFAVIEKKGPVCTALDYGVISTPKSMQAAHRLITIADDLTQLITEYKPQKLVIEQLFFSKNISTGIAVAEARGVILLTAAQYGLPIVEFTPNQIKQIVTGNGAAGKAQVQRMVQEIFHLQKIPKPDDAADALAIAFAGA